jgi:xylulokinase
MSSARIELCLAIDLGTGGPKIGVVTLDGAVMAQEHHRVETFYGPHGQAEQDAAQWWSLITTSAQRLLHSPGVVASDVVAVAVTGQWASTVPVDANGVPTAPCVMWMDSRGGPHARSLVGGRVQGYKPVTVTKWVAKTGGAPSTTGDDPIGHMLYLENEQPEVMARTRWLLEPVDYLTMRFTGVASASHASMQGAWLTDIRHLDRMNYDADLIDLLGLPEEKLARLVPIGSVVGLVQASVASELGLRSDVAVLTGLPDLQAAALGAGAVKLYQAHVALSTTSWISCPVPKKLTDPFHSIGTVPGLTQDSYLLVNNQETGASALEWVRTLASGLGSDMSFSDLTALASTSTPGANGVLFTPWLAGERSPVSDRHARAGFTNLSRRTSSADLVRAVMEGVAYNSRWLLGYVEKATKHELAPLSLMGGGANSELWCQIFADVLQRPVVQIPDPTFAQMRGMAVLASVALGRRELNDIHSVLPAGHQFDANPQHAAMYEERAGMLPEIYSENKKRWRALSRH